MSVATDSLARALESLINEIRSGKIKIVVVDHRNGEKSIEAKRVDR